MYIRIIDVNQIQYPSVSVCVQNTFKKSLDGILFNRTLIKAENLAKENVWKRNETFYFVNHPTVKTNGYPCFTTRDSVDQGKPCSFPFIYNFENITITSYNCSLDDNNKPWCYSKLYQNKTRMINHHKYWGNCDCSCNGEPFEPSSDHNLAKKEFDEFWESDIYDLRTWDSGYCHTYNPPKHISTDFHYFLAILN